MRALQLVVAWKGGRWLCSCPTAMLLLIGVGRELESIQHARYSESLVTVISAGSLSKRIRARRVFVCARSTPHNSHICVCVRKSINLGTRHGPLRCLTCLR